MKLTAKTLFVLVFAVSAIAAAIVQAAPDVPPPPRANNGMRMIKTACATCGRTGELKLHPPDHGQHNGSIHSKDYWDIKCACPVCNGKGTRSVYRLRINQPIADIPACRACGWTGVERCRKCQATGLVRCPGRECKEGWIIRKNEVGGGKNNRHFKMSVDPCPQCKGLGKVVCPECRGLEGAPCRVCNGLGKKVK